MTTRLLTGTYVSGYHITPPVTIVSIATTGYVEGTGVTTPTAATGAYTVVNEGKVASSGAGIYLYTGGSITNGASTDTAASISGTVGVVVGVDAGTVVNFATISASRAASQGVILAHGGSVTNGSASDTQALIQGAEAVGVYLTAGTVRNFGTLQGGAMAPEGGAVYLGGGGSVINGSASDTTALIGGSLTVGSVDGVVAKHLAATVTNFGDIIGASAGTFGGGAYYHSTAILLNAGGRVTNGASNASSAYIGGTYGIIIDGAAGTVSNDGSINAYFTYSHYIPPTQYQGGYTNYYSFGKAVYLQHGGSVTNGGGSGAKASITAAVYGVDVEGAAGTVQNFGFINGQNEHGVTCTGVRLGAGGQVINGSAADPGATIEGDIGVIVAGVGTVTNFGVIAGSGVAAVEFTSAADTLVVEAGSTIHGAVNGADGTLDLASGTGNISVIPYSTVTLAGPTPTTFSGFGTVEVGSGAQFTLTGLGQIRDEAIDTLDLEGVLVVTGELDTGSKTVGAGTLSLQGGTADFIAGASLSVSHVTVAGTSTVDVGGNLAYAGAWTQSAGILSVGTGDQATFAGAADSFAGSFSGAGEVELNAVTATIGSGGLSLTGSGEVVLSDSASSGLVGASAATVLTNVGEFIEGAGKLGGGKLTLVNQSAGYVESLGASVLTIDTGTSTIANAGVIEAVGAGGLTIVSAVANTGRLIAYSSLLTVDGAVTGAGYGQIDTGRLKIAATATFNQNVTFVGAGGTLELAHGQTYTGTVSGFSATGETSLDLDDIAFAVGTTKATFSGTSTGGALTVTDGAHTARINLIGDYLNSTFTTGPGAGGMGTRIIDTRPISWTRQVSGAFATVANWTGGLSPGAANEALLDAPGSTAYIVIASANETVASVQTASTARLAITGGVFTITGGTGSGSNAGQLSVTQNGTLDIGGVFANAKVFYVENNGVVKVAAGGLTLTGSGTLYLADNTLEGVTSGATLTTSNFIYGAGQLGGGQMTLVNQAAGVIESYGSSLFTINTGANTITNAGAFLALGAGGMTIDSAVANTGHFAVNGGSMTVTGAVTGKGYGEVVRGTLDFAGTFNENVIFTSGSTGTLELAHSIGYTGRIQGLSTTGTNALDLADITFTSGVTKATFSGSTTSGVLTVTDGTHTARIGLIGNYAGHTFTTSLGAGGVGTRIVDPPAAGSSTISPLAPPPHAFIAAMAAMGAQAGAIHGWIHDPRQVGRPMLVVPRMLAA